VISDKWLVTHLPYALCPIALKNTMSETIPLNWLFGEIVQKSLFACILIAALLLLTRLGKNRLAPHIRFAIWFLLPIQLLLFVSIPSQWSVKNFLGPQASSLQEAGKMPAVPETPAFQDLPFWAETEAVVKPVSTNWLARIWLGGVLLFAACYGIQLYRLRRDILAGATVVDHHTLKIFEACKRRMNIRSWIMLVESSRIPGPFLIGVLRPVVVVPVGLLRTLTPEEMRHLFLHELAHLKRGDLISGWVMSLVFALHWFNPLVWIAVSVMNHLREEATDAAVLKCLENEHRFDYSNTLLTLSGRLARPQFLLGRAGLLAGILETRSYLQRRIDMITSPINWKKSWAVLALFACAVLSLTLLTDAKPQQENADNTTDSAEKVEKVDPARVPKIVNIFPGNN